MAEDFRCRSGTFPTMSMFQYSRGQELGLNTVSRSCVELFTAATVPTFLKESQVNLGHLNKIFTSQWISENHVAIGSKCNTLMVVDVNRKDTVTLPMLSGIRNDSTEQQVDSSCGIHCIELNPSKTLLATGGDNPNTLAVYRLPSFDPVCLGEDCHTDWIFTIAWIDDEYLVTGSRDGTIALWHVRETTSAETVRPSWVSDTLDPGIIHGDPSPEDISLMDVDLSMLKYDIVRPVTVQQCGLRERVRALAYSKQSNNLASLTLNGMVHLWDAGRLEPVQSRMLPDYKENACLCFGEEYSLYAVGSKNNVSFLDENTMTTIDSVQAKQKGCGVRSVSFNRHIITIGTGAGHMLFFDIRNKKYLESDSGATCTLHVGDGWLDRNEMFQEFFGGFTRYPNAIYTHCYDHTGTRLFAAGGPLPAGLTGNYAALWQ